jgi:ABC-type branched-subunit amino acid transport system substrate-binding protein
MAGADFVGLVFLYARATAVVCFNRFLLTNTNITWPGNGTKCPQAEEVIFIGILLPMTGSWPVGRTIAGAAALAVERINTDASLLRGKRLKFTWLDDGCSSSQGQRSMTDLLRDSNITAVIGPGTERPTPSMRAP